MSFYNPSDVRTLLLIEHEVLEAMKADPTFSCDDFDDAVELQRIRIEAIRKVWQKSEGGFCKSYEEQTEQRVARSVTTREPGRVINVE